MSNSKFMGKCIAGMASATNCMKRGAHNAQQDGKIVDLENRITALTMEIGNLTLLQLDAGLGANEPIMERYEEIRLAREAIETAEGAKQVKSVVCPHCGAKTSAGMRYCGVCGTLLAEKMLPLPDGESA